MRKIRFYSCAAVLICALSASFAPAAPPAITSLYPAGAQRGTSAEVTVSGALDAATRVWADQKGVTAEPLKEKGKYKITVAKDATPGVCWLRAYNDEGASEPRPFLVGLLPEVTEKEPNDAFKKPHVLGTSAVVINGKLEKSGDVDCFAVTLKKGKTLVASLEAHHTLRSPMDGMLQVLSADGFVLAEDNDFRELDPQLAFTAKNDGVYIARVYAFPSAPTSEIRHFGSGACVYRLTLTTEAFADFAVPLAVPRAGRQAVEVRGWNVTPESQQLSFAASANDGHATAFAPGLANPLRLRQEPHPVFAKPDGVLKPPFSVTGLIESPRGEALLSFEGKKGQSLTVHVESRSLGLAVNPVVRVLDRSGKQLARAEPGKLNGDTTLSFAPSADERYAIAVSDLYAGGGTRHAFLLRLLSEPDYELTLASDRFTITPGKPTTIPVKVNRLRGFAKPVEVVAEGLPGDIKVDLTRPAKSDPNTVTLSLTAERSWSGPFRLVGSVKNEPNLSHPARAALPEFDEATADLWLTVLPPAKKK